MCACDKPASFMFFTFIPTSHNLSEKLQSTPASEVEPNTIRACTNLFLVAYPLLYLNTDLQVPSPTPTHSCHASLPYFPTIMSLVGVVLGTRARSRLMRGLRTVPEGRFSGLLRHPKHEPLKNLSLMVIQHHACHPTVHKSLSCYKIKRVCTCGH